jgi:hypothetical protein
MKRLLLHRLSVLAVLAAASFFAIPSAALAGDNWVFKRSYYSHDPVTEVRIGRQFSTGPVFTRPQGQYVKSGYRYERSSTIIPGTNTFDTMNVFESWVQTGAKF